MIVAAVDTATPSTVTGVLLLGGGIALRIRLRERS